MADTSDKRKIERDLSRIRPRVVLYGGLACLLAVGWLASNTAIIPGLDPYFRPREHIDVRIEERDGKRFLWGGPRDDQWFDVTQFRLSPKRLEYGLGREVFPALIDPAFVSVEEADRWIGDDDPVLVARIGGDTHVYPLSLMRRHEVINDVIDGRPVFAAYCLLANLGALYDRRFGDDTYTFAVSGYTYYDWRVWRGYSAFVLWDRETQSLWWPALGKAVSGPSVDIPMQVLDEALWAQTTWSDAIEATSNARVLSRHQIYQPPDSWPSKTPPALAAIASGSQARSVPPRWGRNAELGNK